MNREDLDRRLRGLGRPPTASELDDIRLGGAIEEFARIIERAAQGDATGAVDQLMGSRAQWGSRNVYTAAVLYGTRATTELARATGRAPRKAVRRIGEGLATAAVIEARGGDTA